MATDDNATTETTGTTAAEVAVERVVEIATEQFSRKGFAETKLDTISRASGMSKRMIHYHFGDKQGLYQKALAHAAELLAPNVALMEPHSAVPVEGVRKLVDTIFDQYVAHPEAVRLLTQESVIQSLETTQNAAVTDLSELSLHLDKLLMKGQDAGAFRPGISANDVFVLIASLAMYRTTNKDMMINLLGLDMTNETNTEGMRRMVIDAILAFLTANIPDTGQESYLTAKVEDDESEVPSDVYDSGAGIYD
ncbi:MULTISPECIES: TetR/AcrR family transcriptional regulator [Corynebacterium]|uniref:TetR/AcrR family transcriptional regulator n=2 Tax=Corynebacterium TaxID=1716 RepID=A0A540R6Z6_9CORY|nr:MULTISPECIES: TetR/AcrR family transcriptional regulator [Corynebacterium]KXB54411.1 transcriptional regulator, TetR family [Corynebacterium sp. DNF00584]MBF9011353.1 TetR family transcriptional regulator [Corynebacterium phoceense]OFL76409.1 TetR family transcriptional regulator [Corynebacterium sp. HMSC077B05]OFN43744.1 TetR family transcriptional regulator [Corynebacterium sp. HMSC072G08]OFP17197.1 TetR family transcriptional regulator [Corynebacterium sp. HMSC065A05]